MRSLAIALLAAIAGSACAQLTAVEQNINTAFGLLRQQKEIFVELNGTDQLGSRTNTLYSDATFQWDPFNKDAFARVEVNDFLNNVHTHRLVGDGVNFWAYDFGQNAYSSYHYGAYTGAQPEGFRANLLQELASSSKGTTIFLARLLREIFSAGDISTTSGGSQYYTTWLPMATVTYVAKGTATTSMQDPIATARTYVGDDLNSYVVYTYSSRPQRSAAFHLTRADLTQPWMISDIYYADLQKVNPSTTRFLDWTMTIHIPPFTTPATYVFKPPTTARPIANTKGQGG